MEYEVVMGLEVHVELGTKTKLFCGCPNEFSNEPNVYCCAVCAGFPGGAGKTNEHAIDLAIKAGLALNCDINKFSRFDRKHYFYPDLASAYQTTQFDFPICTNGHIEVCDEKPKTIGIKQIHIEEDAGKLIHDEFIDASYVDYNRSSRVLIEIVSEPDFRTAGEVLQYLDVLRTRLIYAGVSPCKMEEGIMRCDVNISVRPIGQKEFGVRSEIKNMASLRNIERAIASETKRHIKCLETGEKLIQETRGWNDLENKTFAMREKEFATDYRYFPEPSVPPIYLTDEQINTIKSSMPEFPDEKRIRYEKDYGLSAYDTDILITDRNMAEFFENVASNYKNYKNISNWITSDMLGLLKSENVEFKDIKITPEQMTSILTMVDSGTINTTTGKMVFSEIILTGKDPKQMVEEKGLGQISDDGAIRQMIIDAINANPNVVLDYKNGKEKALTFFVGQIMKATKGKSNPKVVNEILKDELAKV